jgi:type IV pilus assembly protein PilB
VSADQAKAVEEVAKADGVSILTALMDKKIVTPAFLADAVANIFSYPTFDLGFFNAEHLLTDIIQPQDMRKYFCLPLRKRGRRLYLGVVDPTLLSIFQKLVFADGLSIEIVVVEHDKIMRILDTISKDNSKILEELNNDELFSGGISTVNEDGESEDGPIAKFVHKVLLDAINIGASDIHFEFYEKMARVRLRIDGQLRELVEPPVQIKELLASRIKVMCNMDISEKRIPQDGRLKLKVTEERAIDFRVNTLPTLFGEKIVMRILDSSAASLNLAQLGFEPKQYEILMEAIHRPYGMVLVTGPTGSGKTVTLYSCLNVINQPEVNISTAEDPAEINLPGINQVNVNDKQGLTFASALKAFLRQDPDVIMVGEIRDLETADISIKAAQTGHMVFSTLHTNNAPATLSRMLNMGVAPFNIASSVNLIIAQRLLRRLCPSCKKEIERPPKDVLLSQGFTEEDLAQDWKLYGACGCDNCRGRGYKGRAGIYELMPISEAMQRVIMNNGTAVDIADIAYAEGMVDLRRAGLLKVMQGSTSLEEVQAKTND